MGGWQGGGAQGENSPDWSRGRVWWALPPDAAQKPAARRTGAGGGGQTARWLRASFLGAGSA